MKNVIEVWTRVCCKKLGWIVNRGEMPIESEYSWFSAKAILVASLKLSVLGRALKVIKF